MAYQRYKPRISLTKAEKVDLMADYIAYYEDFLTGPSVTANRADSLFRSSPIPSIISAKTSLGFLYSKPRYPFLVLKRSRKLGVR